MLLFTHYLKNEKESSQKPGCSVEMHLQVLDKIQRLYRELVALLSSDELDGKFL